MIQGDVPTGDLLFGVAVLAVALPVLYVGGRLIARLRNARFTRDWAELVPTLVGAEVVPVRGGGAASSWLTGRYRGASVFASMTPDVGSGGSSDVHRLENRFETGLRELRGAHDWSVEWTEAVLGLGRTGWQLRADDAALRERLERAGVREIVGPLGRGAVRFGARAGTLVLHQDIRPYRTLPAERFRQSLDVLLRLSEVAGPLNRP